MSALFSPISIGRLELPNRIVIPPMCQYSARDGVASDWHLIHLGQLALSGAGLLIIEATAVSPEGRITPNDLGLYSDEAEAALRRVIESVRKYSDIPIAIQLGHAGRKASSHVPWDGGALIPPESGGWETVAPSSVRYAPEERAPLALDAAGLARLREAFGQAAKRAARMGVDAVEMHAAHGYLLHQFLSPLSNQRSDAYGGSLENRLRFPLEVFDVMRSALPDGMPFGVRLSATDWVEGGWDLEQSTVFCQEVEKRGAAYVHVSSGGLSPLQQIPLVPGYQVPFAEEIRKAVRVPVITVGLITEPEQAESVVASGQADMVAIGRGMLYNPRWPWHAAARLGGSVKAPHQYWRCQPSGLRGLFTGAHTSQR